MSHYRRILCLGVTCFLSFQVAAEALVVDESDNFAMLDEQVAMEQPVAKAQLDEDIPLAQDNGSNNPNLGLLDKLQGMQQEIQELRGQLETQAHDIKLLRQQQLSFYNDLDNRLRTTNPKGPQTPSAMSMEKKLTEPSSETTHDKSTSSGFSTTKVNDHPRATAFRGNPADEQISYLAAYDLVKNKRFDDAMIEMDKFVTKYPNGGFTANAQYWLGELYLVKNNYPKAIEHFEIVLKQFPSSSKTAASSLKIGYALAASGKIDDAKVRLRDVLKNYPDTPTAQLAAMKLESLSVS